MARLRDVVIDAERPAALARFWAAVLDGYSVARYDDEELARLRSLGIDDPEDDPTVLVESPDSTLRIWLQHVPERKANKNRVHLDLEADDVDAESDRLVRLGARIAMDQPNDTLIVMHDPEGNEFCLLRS